MITNINLKLIYAIFRLILIQKQFKICTQDKFLKFKSRIHSASNHKYNNNNNF